MSTTNRWGIGLLLVMAGAVVWRISSGRPRSAPPEREVAVREPTPRLQPPAPLAQRTEVPAQPDEPTKGGASDPTPAAEPTPARSALAWNLARVTDSFLSEQPRVTELLELIEFMAERAVVEPESVSSKRGPEDELVFVRGRLAIDDVHGTFLVDPDGYTVQFPTVLDEGPWSRCDLQITFQAGEPGPWACYATVQFQPGKDEVVPAAFQGVQELVIGWSVGTSREDGTRARALTLGFVQDRWASISSERTPDQDFPAVDGSAGFAAWLRVLEPHVTGSLAPR